MDIDLPLLDRMYKEMDNPSQKLVELRNKIKDAEGYIAVTPEYNRSTSSALKNTLDYFLEEYYFKSSAIVSYSPGMFGGVNAAQQLRLDLCRAWSTIDTLIICNTRVHKVFDENGTLIDEAYIKRIGKFLDEFEWYTNALTNQRALGTPY